MSLYLFILVAEGSFAPINRVMARGDIHRVHICRVAPRVCHLLFADDYFLIYKDNLIEVTNLMEFLKVYAEASGQGINMTKSECFQSNY